MSRQDTICALASGPPPAALAIVRVSGPGVPDILDTLVSGDRPEPRRSSLRHIRTSTGALIDTGLVVFMPGPSSFTGEDSLEITVHGGAAIIEDLLSELISGNWARLAEPGEFTRRAFEADKLDLIQAEGIADLIESETSAQRSQALRQLGGALSETYETWRLALRSLIASLEALIDFPDEGDAPDEVDPLFEAKLLDLTSQIEKTLGDGGAGERLRDGFRVAIVGSPNAGKSTLLNALTERDMAIVTDQAGTTRDTIEARMRVGGGIIWLIDTAGLRSTEERIEAEGVKRAEAAARGADLRLHVVDGTEELGLNSSAALRDEEDIVVWNKCDLVPPPAGFEGVALSAREGAGLEKLKAALTMWVESQVQRSESSVITRARHRTSLSQALDALNRAQNGLQKGVAAELISEDLRAANRGLGAVVGTVGVEDVLGEVFSTFCIGK